MFVLYSFKGVLTLTLKDIAAQANVSISTVSRVLNGSISNAASQKVQQNILKIAREGGYLPNKEAQALKHSGKAASEKTVHSIYCLIACVKNGSSLTSSAAWRSRSSSLPKSPLNCLPD
jgi:DNA-binding LacI/PurR family transcriptional regulator